ncbi:hypothetical protein KDN24_17070 [Bacillus sp. Bva_UNVM-123]|uniref:hypothetical protein n=1 Tax=Bacillus sp. Bva_UNVM-123 TaxID=2829798 RepID=UPI00391F9AE2
MQLLFWPFMIVSVILSILSIRLRRPKLLIISAILILPMSMYLAATPRFEYFGFVFPLFYVGAALSLVKKNLWLSILFVIPNFFLICWLGAMVFN